MNLQILEVIPARPSQSGKMIPPKVKFSDGTEAAISKDIPPQSLQVGAWGEAGIATKQNGQYTNHSLVTWTPTIPAGQPPAQFPAAPPAQQTQAKVDNAVWDAKDRTIAVQGMAKPAAEIVSALISAGIIADIAGASAAYDTFCKQGFELTQLARAGRIATAHDPFADE